MDSQGGPSRHGPQGRPPRPAGAPRVSPRVYRRRRLVVLILALLILGGLIWAGITLAGIIGGQNADDAAAASSESASASPPAPASAAEGSPSPAPEESEPAEPTCDPAQVVVSAATDATAYAPEQNPVLTLTVTNNGDVACPVNVGTSQMEFLVTSGEDRIFSSVDCQEGPEDLDRDIPPGGSEEANFTWERNRSAPGCEAVEVNPTPGFYNLTVTLGERTSEETSFELQ